MLDEVVAVREACGSGPDRAHLKVILETGELATLDNVRRASVLAMIGGADFIKTSTGKVAPASTRPVTMVMLQSVVDFRAATGTQVGVKSAGGIRSSGSAWVMRLNNSLPLGLPAVMIAWPGAPVSSRRSALRLAASGP